MTEARNRMLKLVTDPAVHKMRRPKHEVTLNLTSEEFATLSALARNQDTTREGAVIWMLDAASVALAPKGDE